MRAVHQESGNFLWQEPESSRFYAAGTCFAVALLAMKHPDPTLILVRHGQASLGEADYDRLTPLGHHQAKLLAARLGRCAPALLIRGEHLRHRQTAAALADVEARVAIDSGLNEYSVQPLLQAAAAQAEVLGIEFPPAAAQGDPRAFLEQFLAMFPAVLDAWQQARIDCRHNGSWAAFSQRVEDAGQRLVEHSQRHGCVIAFTSAGVISTLTAILLRRDLAWQRRLNVTLYNASVTQLRYCDGGWHVVAENCIEHLPDRTLHSLA